jgi:hypothetical protein
VPLTPPKLDERTFKDLFEGARTRIPNYLPEWTDWNESDPGITLLQLQAWLTETLLYQLNRLPELYYVKFLQLLGIEQLPARAATADVTFVLDENKLKGRPQIEIPAGTLLRVASRDLPEPVYFQTDQTLTAINAKLALLVSLYGESTDRKREDVTLLNDLDNAIFPPFGPSAQAATVEADKAQLLLAFASSVPMSREEFGIQIYLKDEPLAPLATPTQDDCGPETTDPQAPIVRWEWFDGLTWQILTVTDDQTEHLRRSGKVFVKIPGQIPAVPAHAMDLVPIPLPPNLARVRHVTSTILADFADASPPIQSVSQLAARKEGELYPLLEPHLTGSSDDEKHQQLKEMLEDAKRLIKSSSPPLYYWLRMLFDQGQYSQVPEVDRILINTASASAARTANDEVVGSSDGLPNQVMKLRQAPVMDEPRKSGEPRKSTLELQIDEGEGLQTWHEISDFAGSKPDSRHYLLNRTTGEIRFGDNRRGHIPRAGQANVIARKYTYGGGRSGNVGAHTITDMVRRIDGVKEIFNLRQATGGMDEEPIQETLVRVPRELRANQRAVTLQDFGELARQTPGAQVARAYAYMDHNISGLPNDCTSAIRVVVVPRTQEVRPSPTETTIRLVCEYLDERRLVTTQVRVQGPSYHDVIVKMEVKIRANADKTTVRSAIEEMLKRLLHPLEGGPDGSGWPFGQDIYYSELVREVMLIPGVIRVDPLRLLKLMGTVSDTSCDRGQFVSDVTVPDGTLLAPGTTFNKTWRLRNAGSCTWTISYQLVFFSGAQMGGPSAVALPNTVAPGQTVDLSVSLVAPNTAGSYRGYWMFRNAAGELFGLGSHASEPWRVDIKVSGSSASASTLSGSGACLPTYEVRRFVDPPRVPGEQTKEWWGIMEVYDCCDLPVDEGALVALVDTEITVDYDRRGA